MGWDDMMQYFYFQIKKLPTAFCSLIKFEAPHFIIIKSCKISQIQGGSQSPFKHLARDVGNKQHLRLITPNQYIYFLDLQSFYL